MMTTEFIEGVPVPTIVEKTRSYHLPTAAKWEPSDTGTLDVIGLRVTGKHGEPDYTKPPVYFTKQQLVELLADPNGVAREDVVTIHKALSASSEVSSRLASQFREQAIFYQRPIHAKDAAAEAVVQPRVA